MPPVFTVFAICSEVPIHILHVAYLFPVHGFAQELSIPLSLLRRPCGLAAAGFLSPSFFLLLREVVHGRAGLTLTFIRLKKLLLS